MRFDAGARAAYSADASNYRQVPIGVVLPRSLADVEAAVAACHSHGAPILPRGCGTSLNGQTVNVASRIAEYARPGEVVVSQAVVDATGDVPLTFAEVGMVELKGVSEPIRLHVAHLG